MNQHPREAALTAGREQDHLSGSPGGPDRSISGSVLSRAVAETLGSDATDSLRGVTGISHLIGELELRCGQQAGHGMAVRIGRACFLDLVRRIGDKAGITQPAFRLLPLVLRLRQGFLAFRGLFADFGGRGIRLEEQNGKLFWRLQDCPICSGGRATEPVCFLMLGMLSEAVSWLGGGRFFEVQEIACRGRGDQDCVFLIDPAPLEL